MTIPVDRQDYVTAYTTTNPSDGTTIDPYDADPSSIHVAISGGKEFARSFVHMALDYLPDGAVPTDLTMTLHLTQQSDASNTGVYPIYNVNNTQAIVQACALVRSCRRSSTRATRRRRTASTARRWESRARRADLDVLAEEPARLLARRTATPAPR